MMRAHCALPVALLLLLALPRPGLAQEDALAAALLANRHTMELRADGVLSGPGADLLLEAGRQARFFFIGEEHGVAEIPELTASLFRGLAPHGYQHLAIETGDGVAAELNRLMLQPDPLAALGRFAEEHFPGVPFYTLREEAALIAEAVRATGGRADVLWGLDYDIVADRWPLRRLRAIAPNAQARAAADRAIAFADSLLAAALEQRNPGFILMFGGPDSIPAMLRRTYRPAPDSEADRILHLMEETRAINAHWIGGEVYASNDRRARFNKQQLWRFWSEAERSGRDPRVMLKFGASHAVRGRTFTNVFDIGSLASEIADARGERSFHVLVIGGPGTQHAVTDPTVFRYRPVPVELAAAAWAAPAAALADPARWTVFDLRPLRPLLGANRLGEVPDRMRQVIWGFDAFVILSGSTAASELLAR